MNREEFLKKNKELVEKYVHDKEKNKMYIELQKAMCEEFAAMQKWLDLYESLSARYGDIMMYPCLCKHFITHRYNWFTFCIKSLGINIDFCLEKEKKDLMFQLWRGRNILLFDLGEYNSIKDNQSRIDFVINEIENKIERNKVFEQNKKKEKKAPKVVENKPKIAENPTKRKRIRIGEKVKY